LRRSENTLIVNADDFGLHHGVNMAIVRAFERGLCSSCSVMPNMPGFEEACELAHRHGFVEHTGLHLTLTEGKALTDAIKQESRFCDEKGHFHLSRKKRVISMSRLERAALQQEIRAQVASCREQGLRVSHLDSHNHAHEEWAIASSVMNVAREEGIASVRLSRNFGRNISVVKRVYKYLINTRLRQAGLARTDYFGSPDDHLIYCTSGRASGASAASWEIMLHPDLDGCGRLVDSWLRRPLEDLVAHLPEA